MLGTRDIDNSKLEALARLGHDPDFAQFAQVLLAARAAALELLACERDPQRLRQLQGEVTAIAQAVKLPEECRKALVARRKAAGS